MAGNSEDRPSGTEAIPTLRDVARPAGGPAPPPNLDLFTGSPETPPLGEQHLHELREALLSRAKDIADRVAQEVSAEAATRIRAQVARQLELEFQKILDTVLQDVL